MVRPSTAKIGSLENFRLYGIPDGNHLVVVFEHYYTNQMIGFVLDNMDLSLWSLYRQDLHSHVNLQGQKFLIIHIEYIRRIEGKAKENSYICKEYNVVFVVAYMYHNSCFTVAELALNYLAGCV